MTADHSNNLDNSLQAGENANIQEASVNCHKKLKRRNKTSKTSRTGQDKTDMNNVIKANGMKEALNDKAATFYRICQMIVKDMYDEIVLHEIRSTKDWIEFDHY